MKNFVLRGLGVLLSLGDMLYICADYAFSLISMRKGCIKLNFVSTFRGQHHLARECSKLDPKYEQALAEEGLTMELEEWPEY